MYNIYMDIGTSNTRVYLINGFELVDTESINIGTKDSAITGSKDILLSTMKGCYDKILTSNHLCESDIEGLWSSGVVTNSFGIVEVEHLSTPIYGQKLLDRVYTHYEDKYFKRNMMLIPGAKTVQPGQKVTIENVDRMNNVRGEEIEVVGMVATDILPKDKNCVMISPGSHTHFCHVVEGALVDIVSNFTGELDFAIKKETILSGELSNKEIEMDPAFVNRGYKYLKEYGISRALYIIHATKVFDVCSDEARSQIMAGVISGSVIDLLAMKIKEDWKAAEKIVIIGGKSYVESYRILCETVIPNIPVKVIKSYEGKSFALCGFLELLRLTKVSSRKII